MFGSTMLLTVGHALDRAKDEGLVVRLHIGGDWVSGRVLNSDGHGVAIMEPNGDLCVVRQEVITCVRLPGSPPGQPAGPPSGAGRASNTAASAGSAAPHVPAPHVPAQATAAIASAN